MSIRQRVYGAFLAWIVGTLLFGIGMTHDPRFIVGLLLLLVAVAVVTMRARCPVCKYPVLKRERRTSVGHLTVWVAHVPKCCTNCGAPLQAFERAKGRPESRAKFTPDAEDER